MTDRPFWYYTHRTYSADKLVRAGFDLLAQTIVVQKLINNNYELFQTIHLTDLTSINIEDFVVSEKGKVFAIVEKSYQYATVEMLKIELINVWIYKQLGSNYGLIDVYERKIKVNNQGSEYNLMIDDNGAISFMGETHG